MNDAPNRDEGVPPKRRRSGSERRQKGRLIPFRVSEAEGQELDALATRAGLTRGSYIRSRVLATPTTRAIRRPVVEVQVLTKLLAELGRVGSNINQLARRVNMNDTPLAQDISAALITCRQVAEHAKDVLDRNT